MPAPAMQIPRKVCWDVMCFAIPNPLIYDACQCLTYLYLTYIWHVIGLNDYEYFFIDDSLILCRLAPQRPRGEAHGQPAVPGRGQQAVQRGQPGLQRQQRRDHRAQHGRVSGQPVQSAQRGSRGARQLPARPHRRLLGHQRRAQLSRHTRLTPNFHRGGH